MADRLTTLPPGSPALLSLESLPALPPFVPTGLEQAWEYAARILAGVDAEGRVAWGEQLAAAAIVYSSYDTYARERVPQGLALEALRVAVGLLEAGLEDGAGIDASHLDSWATMAMIGHGMLGEHDYDSPGVPDLAVEHPATLTAAALSSTAWLPAAAPERGLLPAPYAELMHEYVLVASDSPAADPSRLDSEDFDGLYAQCVRAAVNDGQTMDICYLSYARLALKQRVAAHSR